MSLSLFINLSLILLVSLKYYFYIHCFVFTCFVASLFIRTFTSILLVLAGPIISAKTRITVARHYRLVNAHPLPTPFRCYIEVSWYLEKFVQFY